MNCKFKIDPCAVNFDDKKENEKFEVKIKHYAYKISFIRCILVAEKI